MQKMGMARKRPTKLQGASKKRLSPAKSRAQVCDVVKTSQKADLKTCDIHPFIISTGDIHSSIHFPITALDLHATEHLRLGSWKRLKEPETF